MPRKGLGGGVESGESSTGDAPNPNLLVLVFTGHKQGRQGDNTDANRGYCCESGAH